MNWFTGLTSSTAAQYTDAKTAVELGAPAMKLTLVVEGSKGSETVQKIIRWMQHRRSGGDRCRARKLSALIRTAVQAPPGFDRYDSQPRPPG